MIIISELLRVDKVAIISYTFFVMLAGIAAAYLVMFKGVKNQSVPEKELFGLGKSLLNFVSGFLASWSFSSSPSW